MTSEYPLENSPRRLQVSGRYDLGIGHHPGLKMAEPEAKIRVEILTVRESSTISIRFPISYHQVYGKEAVEMMDHSLMKQAIDLAVKAEKDGNLPVGSLITFKGEIVSEGPSRVYQPRYDLTRHAEMEAIRALPPEYWTQSQDLVLYTTLAPCLMCLGGILLNSIPRVVYGAEYDGGLKALADHLPPFFKNRYQAVEWVGPLMPAECDPLHKRLLEIEKERSG